MSLIKSISGIRGTIGGQKGDALTPQDIVSFTAAYSTWVLSLKKGNTVIIGRDARSSGLMVTNIVSGTLMGMGINVIDLGLSTTPTVEIAVKELKAAGGIIITASHNPKQWNALKLLNNNGEFISDKEGQAIVALAENEAISFEEVDNLGSYTTNDTFLQKHIDLILAHPLVKVEAIQKQNFTIALDAINSTGNIFVPALLNALGVNTIYSINDTVDGHFAHNPEPLPEHLAQLSKAVTEHKAHLGIAVDPDVDRLALVCEDGSMFGEEYTLVAVADYVLKHKKGNTVSNLSSTRALQDITEKHGGSYTASAVGEVNVVNAMKASRAVIGGEGNGGIIVPELHYGRDALIGIALFLSHLAEYGKSVSLLRNSYPSYYITKNKIVLEPGMDIDNLMEKIKTKYKAQPINTIDGVKIHFDKEWVHLRRSNTEPIIRIYTEGITQTTSETLSNKLMQDIGIIING